MLGLVSVDERDQPQNLDLVCLQMSRCATISLPACSWQKQVSVFYQSVMTVVSTSLNMSCL